MVALCDFDWEDALFLLKTSAFHVSLLVVLANLKPYNWIKKTEGARGLVRIVCWYHCDFLTHCTRNFGDWHWSFTSCACGVVKWNRTCRCDQSDSLTLWCRREERRGESRHFVIVRSFLVSFEQLTAFFPEFFSQLPLYSLYICHSILNFGLETFFISFMLHTWFWKTMVLGGLKQSWAIRLSSMNIFCEVIFRDNLSNHSSHLTGYSFDIFA